MFAFAYEDEAGVWYDWNPLLGELKREAKTKANSRKVKKARR